MEMYEVGGCVRDEILGIASKDIDFTVVLGDGDFRMGLPNPYDVMVLKLERMGIVPWVNEKTGEIVGANFLTVRGKAPKDFPLYPGRDLDFVLARKERDYDGRRPAHVEPGTLMDDLERRDFTMNAIAKDLDGNYIDPFNGRAAIEEKCIYAVGDPRDRFREDALRAIRALRFSVTKGFHIAEGVQFAMQLAGVLDDIAGPRISDERIREELSRMFAFDTVASLAALSAFPQLTAAMFSGSVSLDATMKQKGKGRG